MSEYVRGVNESDFDQVVLQSKTLVLVDFWAECRIRVNAVSPGSINTSGLSDYCLP